MATLYDVLELPPDATQEEIQVAYREKVKEYHPDVSDHPDAESRFRTVQRAEEVLGDPDERERYDRLGHDSYGRVVDVPDLDGWETVDHGDRSTDGDEPGTDRGRGISVGDSTDRERESDASDGSTGSEGSGDDDWWEDVWESGSGDPGGRGTRPPRRSYSVGGGSADANAGGGGGSGATSRSSRVTDAADQNRRAPRAEQESFWDAEVEAPVESTPRYERLVRDLRSGEAMLLSLVLCVIYPIFVYFSLDPTLSVAVNIIVGVTTIGVAIVTLIRPAVSLIVFGVWSLLSPLLLAFLGKAVASFVGMIVLGAFWLPLALTVLVILAAPR